MLASRASSKDFLSLTAPFWSTSEPKTSADYRLVLEEILAQDSRILAVAVHHLYLASLRCDSMISSLRPVVLCR